MLENQNKYEDRDSHEGYFKTELDLIVDVVKRDKIIMLNSSHHLNIGDWLTGN
ncbi:hypothetical protein L3V77_04810 [Vibrio sp. DW001]|uniref:hypothetical protein n=1 Tax=Vibrio sp. DW001 TaxID=2912315 RepID=UPI0023B0D8FD|nr:hypothetical protein [Vibrio sp. DW001]WED27557.1 hypothetical protein L3V77_04810 [Vibrio sp. DW001]